MKFVRIIAIVLGVILLIFLGLSLTAPKNIDVSRSLEIDAPADLIFTQINDVTNWEKWGPWMDEDPDMKFEYNEQTVGVGASYSWISEETGNGSLTITEQVDNESQVNTLNFEGFGESKGYWNLEPTENGTKVTWGMQSDNSQSPFMARWMGHFMDGMVGGMYEEGLANIAEVVGAEKEAWEAAKAEEEARKAAEAAILEVIDSMVTEEGAAEE